jgi:hypothetical protein
VILDSQATLEPAQELVAGRMVSGFRAPTLASAPQAHHPLQPQELSAPPADQQGVSVRVFYPASYDEAFVVELGAQRVVLQAVGVHFAQAAASAGKLFYPGPHDSVDVIEVPSTDRSEELLVLHDARAPRIFEYEIAEMRGVAGLTVQDGTIRFTPDHMTLPAVRKAGGGWFSAPTPSLQIDRPWVIDANGKRSENAAQWTIVEEQDQPRRLRLTINSDQLAYPLIVDPSFSVTGTMSLAREGHTATLLPGGKVLIAGSEQAVSFSRVVELYDPATATFSVLGAQMTGGSAVFRSP